MGIQIYIKKKAIQERFIPVIYSTETVYEGCEESVEYADVKGIPFLMEVFEDSVYHDANRYGSSRKPLLEFIEKHNLKAGEDWFEH